MHLGSLEWNLKQPAGECECMSLYYDLCCCFSKHLFRFYNNRKTIACVQCTYGFTCKLYTCTTLLIYMYWFFQIQTAHHFHHNEQ